MNAPQVNGSPLLAFIVPAWGVGPFLGEALASLQAQTRPDWQAVVVDDGDTARVAAAAAPYLSDPRIRLLATDNGGTSVARNRAVATTDAPFLAFLDGDDRFRSDYLELMLPPLLADASLGFVTSDARMFGSPAFEGRLFSNHQPQTGEITLERVLRRTFNVVGSSVVRREAFEGVSGYDPELRASEDFDLWLRILGEGWRGTLVPEPLVEYRRRAGSLSAASLPLAQTTCAAYRKAIARLAGRPEQAAARAALAQAENAVLIEEGLAAVVRGETAAGLRMLYQTDLPRHSTKWRLAMAAFRLMPPVAGPILRSYVRGSGFSGPAKAAA
jgi:glycosyltransferase involved in cell wall biosynthesis